MKRLGVGRSTDEIRDRLAQVRAGDRARWGTMTAAAMVCHLREAFRLAMGELEAEPVKMPLPPGLIKWISLSLPMPWPKNLGTVKELKMGERCRPDTFAEDYTGLCRAFELFVDATENRTPHPFFGAMTTKDWMRWGYLHTDHHLRQFGR